MLLHCTVCIGVPSNLSKEIGVTMPLKKQLLERCANGITNNLASSPCIIQTKYILYVRLARTTVSALFTQTNFLLIFMQKKFHFVQYMNFLYTKVSNNIR